MIKKEKSRAVERKELVVTKTVSFDNSLLMIEMARDLKNLAGGIENAIKLLQIV
jgi:hypothetical protein